MKERKWSREQEQFLIENYETMKTDELIINLKDKTNDQIRWKAKTYKLHKKVTKSKKDISWLKDLSIPENCYWWGFLMADGCFTKNQLILSVSNIDREHIEKFSYKTKAKISDVCRINDWNPRGCHMLRIAINDKITIQDLADRFEITDRKTYNPFNIDEFLTEDKLCSFIVGVIDGDGHIDKFNKNIKIKVHPNWIDKFIQISNALQLIYNIPTTIRYDKCGWLILTITAKGSRILKSLITNSNIPYMNRKWDRIDAV